ncbi:hypothetical protein T08_7223 [Trichinella sp. T8]|nr:hypothetical protein T08_7223 [Trichinella sp. T8]
MQWESQQVMNCPQLQFELKPGQATANLPVHQDNQPDQPPDPQMAVSAKPHNVTVEPVKTRIPHHSEHP